MMTAEDISRWAFLSYWGVMLFILIVIWLVILWRIKSGHRWWIGGLATVLVVSSFSLPIFKSIQKDKQKVVVKNEKYLAAKAVFDERCKDAGYKIYKTVEDVEGVTLLNVWPREKRKEDQMWEYAGLPKAFGGDSYIRGFLLWREWDYQIKDYYLDGQGFASNKRTIPYSAKEAQRYKAVNSYQYVDVWHVADWQNQGYQRYQFKDLYDLDEITTTAIKKPSRYTVEFENPIIPADRKIWLATTKAFVKDQQTGELLGEATWHSLHGGQGVKKYSTTGMWDRATVCPDIANSQHSPIQYFVLKVLKPKQLPQEPAAQTTSDTTAAKPSQAQPNHRKRSQTDGRYQTRHNLQPYFKPINNPSKST